VGGSGSGAAGPDSVSLSLSKAARPTRKRISREDRWCSENRKPMRLRSAWPLAERYAARLQRSRALCAPAGAATLCDAASRSRAAASLRRSETPHRELSRTLRRCGNQSGDFQLDLAGLA
jgi:hypothetical protein